MKSLQKRVFLTIALVLFVVSILISSTPQIVRHSSQKEFERGKPKGVSINDLGEIRLSPRTDEVHKSELPFIWAAVHGASGAVYFAGGNEARVFALANDGTVREYFKAGEKQIYALAVDRQENLFVATSPDGQVYKIKRGAQSSPEQAVFFDPKEIYVWDLAVDGQGNLFVATGEKGNVYKVDAAGAASLFYEGEDKHVRTLMIDRSGNLIAGTSDKGMVLRIDDRGKAFVLYDSPLIEITGLSEDREGKLFASASGDAFVPRTPPRPSSSAAGSSEEISGGEDENVIELPVQTIAPSGAPRGAKENTEVYRIDGDGTVKTFWSSSDERVHAVIFGANGDLILGTGEPARIYSLDADGRHTLLAELDELQVTELAKDADGNLKIFTSNSGKVYEVGTALNSEGEYLSDVIDASISSKWGAINWELEKPSGTEIVFHTRSGNSEKPDKTWTAWSEPLSNPDGQPISSPQARYLQYKAVFSSRDVSKSAVLKEVSLSYLQKNMSPEIDDIVIHSPGDFYPESVKQISIESHLTNGSLGNSNSGNNSSPGRKTFKKGARTVSWNATDENGDQLLFDLYYRGEDEKKWKLLIKDFHGSLYSWDSELLPDGRYFIKIVARDAPSNPPTMALTSEKVSQPFKIDNTGPVVSDIKVQKSGNGARISFVVRDEMTSIGSVEFGLNAEEWKLIYPVDGICDSKLENFEFETKELIAGVNNFVVKAKDANGNIGFGKSKLQF